jgi:hypothetical protein
MSFKRLTVCPICGRHNHCSLILDTGAIICMKRPSDRPTRNGGWIHGGTAGYFPHGGYEGARLIDIDLRSQCADFNDIAAKYRAAAWPAMIEDYAAGLGLSVASLDRLGIGWAFDQNIGKGKGTQGFDAADAMMRHCGNRVCSFPMRDTAGKIIGIKFRDSRCEKWSMGGSREGLFIPADLRADGPLLITEGITDTAAMVDLGFAAIGRPSCTGGGAFLVELVKGKDREIVIVSDTDTPGVTGADRLANHLRTYSASVRVIAPPSGVKDARAWRNAGATHADVMAAIKRAERRNLTITINTSDFAGIEAEYV